MTGSQQDDIQITSASTGSPSTAASTSAASTSQSSAVVTPVTPVQTAAPTNTIPPVSSTTTAPTVAATPTVPQSTQPTNQRAFNLDSDSDQASSIIKPEKYAIPKMVSDKYPELVELVKSTESMDDEEREYWFQILPVMTPDQIEKFKGILKTEKQQLSDLDKEYEDELSRLNDKHLLEWKEFETKEKSKAIKDAEAASTVDEKQLEADLLAKLSDV